MNINKTIMHRFYLLLILAISLAISCSTAPEELSDDMSGPLTEDATKVDSPPFNDSEIIPIAHIPARGPAAAPVSIVMFTDLQCPFCQRAVLTIAQLQQSYPDEIKLVLKHNPLPFHEEAAAAAYATIAAGNQGFYWEMHDWIFSNQAQLRDNRGSIKAWTAQYAGQLGMDVAQFEADFDAPETLAIVARDMELAQKLGARGTPTFFINGERLVGAQPLISSKKSSTRRSSTPTNSLKLAWTTQISTVNWSPQTITRRQRNPRAPRRNRPSRRHRFNSFPSKPTTRTWAIAKTRW